jgi:hypothetical protein
MRPFFVGVLVLAGIFTIGGGLEPISQRAEAAVWRRTAQGWENMVHWPKAQPAYESSLHPVVMAGFQLLASLFVLVAAYESPNVVSNGKISSCSMRREKVRRFLHGIP